MNSMKKYVVSNSLQTAEWQNSEIISGDVAQKLNDIKAQDGGDIAMSGSATTVRWLLRQGLLDELNLLVHSDRGRRRPGAALSAGRAEHPLELLSAQTFKTRRAEPQLRPGRGTDRRAATRSKPRHRGDRSTSSSGPLPPQAPVFSA